MKTCQAPQGAVSDESPLDARLCGAPAEAEVGLWAPRATLEEVARRIAAGEAVAAFAHDGEDGPVYTIGPSIGPSSADEIRRHLAAREAALRVQGWRLASREGHTGPPWRKGPVTTLWAPVRMRPRGHVGEGEEAAYCDWHTSQEAAEREMDLIGMWAVLGVDCQAEPVRDAIRSALGLGPESPADAKARMDRLDDGDA